MKETVLSKLFLLSRVEEDVAEMAGVAGAQALCQGALAGAEDDDDV